ncbi:efflux RND transporter permease subunit [Pedobacter nutrimenti]|uniref:efflux RND transporter permease subunit n=1 Tax=Pedobacter nutrimenti TaxID=1241337 RepID=UPI00292D2C7F|nr:efflux RND transporter permease subunit [Pedobacter nutrimenti]
MLKKIINRPVTATVISLILVILGFLALQKLPMETFPEIAPPSVVVSARYPGASAEAVARSVATPLEQMINGVENMIYMTSSSSNDGVLNITVYFKLGTNPDQAAINVQNRVSQAVNQLPQEVVRTGINTSKQNNSMIMIIDLESTNPKYDAAFLNNYDLINIIPAIQRIQGVGKAQVFGSKDYAMRIWLNPSKLASYNMTPQEVMTAINNQNLEAAPGKLGEGSTTAFEYTIKYKGKLNEEPDYEDIVIRANPDGSLLKLKDVAKIELGSLDHVYASAQTLNGHPGIGVAIFQTPGSNANDIQIAILDFMEQAKKNFPGGINYRATYSTKRFLDASISQVEHTLIEAFILVFIVVFIFLQDFRSTLIPAISVPVAIIGTFFFMNLFGITINLLTLFALVLAIGVVVDDAIVVVEAVHHKLQSHSTNAKKATTSAMSEITGAILSITLVMSAVFLPIGLIEGPVGVFYRQFAFTLAIAIVLSAINALTLSPALCAILLKNMHNELHENKNKTGIQRFYHLFNTGFNAATKKYKNTIYFLIKRKWFAIAGLIIITIATVFLAKRTPQAFIPTEDQSFVMTAMSMPPGTSLEHTKTLTKQASEKLRKFDGVYFNAIVNGSNLLANTVSPSYAASYTILKQPKDRGNIKDINQIMDSVKSVFDALPEGNSFTYSMPTVPGFGNVDALDVVLKDNTGGSINKLASVNDNFMESLRKRKEIAATFTSFNAKFPQYMLEVDAIKAKQLGLEVSDVLQTMQAYFGGIYSSDFNRFGKYYRVVVQAEAPFRADEQALNEVYAKNNSGNMVPLKSVIQLKRVFGPEVVTHLNQATSINLNVQAKKGFSTGDAMKAINEVAKSLPTGYSHEYTGMAREEQQSGNQTVFIFGICIIFVYFLLSAQYESYLLPLAVILSLPTGIFGVFAFINMMGVTNNIYVQIGMIMLIGLLAKNAILIVEFAVQIRHKGKSLVESAMQAAALRLRPILMTSFAFIAGLLPLLFAGGATEQGNRSIASSAIGGMAFGVALGIFIIPVLFIIFQSIHEKLFGIKHLAPEEE